MAALDRLAVDPVPKRMPKPYRQGDLDTLCGIYAVINACRNASYTLDPNLPLSGRDLFKAIIGTLESQGGIARLYEKAQNQSQVELCLHLAGDYLRDNLSLRLTYQRYLAKEGQQTAKDAFAAVALHLERPGHSALLRFSTTTHVHWTVIRELRTNKLIPSDSAWFKPMALSGFELEMLPLRRKRYCFEEDDLILINLQTL